MVLAQTAKTTTAKVKEFVAWLKEQFMDPTSGMHAMGFGTVSYELIRSWYTKTPLDMQKMYVAFGLFGGGFIGDKWIPSAKDPQIKT